MQVSKEQIQQARQSDLYRFLVTHHDALFKRIGISIVPKNNESLSIKQGYSGYCDFATGEKGNSIDFLTKHLSYKFDDAVMALTEEQNISRIDYLSEKLSKNVIDLPVPVLGRPLGLYRYLRGRGIRDDIISYLVKIGLVYEDHVHHNIVFLNHEKDWAEIRGTDNEVPFHSTPRGSRTDGFWWLQGSAAPQKAYICESCIDAISLYQIHRQAGKTDAFYIGIGGSSKQSTIERIAKQMPVVLAVDNDKAGELCRQKNSQLKYIVPKSKDWNEDLQQREHMFDFI